MAQHTATTFERFTIEVPTIFQLSTSKLTLEEIQSGRFPLGLVVPGTGLPRATAHAAMGALLNPANAAPWVGNLSHRADR